MSYIYLILMLFSGCAVVSSVVKKLGLMTRLWLGMGLGFLMLMWLPSLYAFFLDFTLTAQYMALGTALLLAAAALIFRPVRQQPLRTKSEPHVSLVLWLVIPLVLVMAYLQFTHDIQPRSDGAYWTGQSTYGDLNLHLGIATGLVNAQYPPQYTLLPGTLLGYPFLCDAASATLYMLGMPLRWAFIVPGVLMSMLVFWGFVMLSWLMTHSRRTVVLSYLLVFLNGGFGFTYIWDMVGKDPSRLKEVFTGFYKAPANMVDKNIRWVNVIVDMMLPQRTLMAGWMAILPALWMLIKAVRRRNDLGLWILLGIWAGTMPMVHTHSFMALGLISLAVFPMSVIAEKKERKALITGFLIYGFTAVLLAAPQLFTWTFPQTTGGGSLRFRFNWSNNQNGLIDEYFWFWLKNVGPVFLILIPAFLHTGHENKRLFAGAFLVFAAAELVQFQPNDYDNNKLFYVAFLTVMPIAAEYLVALYDKLKGLPGRRWLAVVFLAVSVCSGTLSLGREIVSEYQLYPAAEVQASEYIKENLPQDATFLTATNHNNAVASLTGRNIVCGTASFLYYHGVDYKTQQEAAKCMFEEPELYRAMFDEYNVDYVYISPYERSSYQVDEEAIAELFTLIYNENGIHIYQTIPAK